MGKSALKFEDYTGLVNWASWRVVARAARSGIKVEQQDIYQELAIVWVNCSKGFDPDHGVKFSTYFVRAAFHEYRRIVNRLAGPNARETVSMDRGPSAHPFRDDGDNMDFVLADHEADNPETRAIRDSEVEEALDASPLLRRLSEVCLDPDEEMQRELAALKAQVDWAKRIGAPLNSQAPTGLTPRMAGKAMGLNWRGRRKLINAIGAVQ
jgi:hypothetical protein